MSQLGLFSELLSERALTKRNVRLSARLSRVGATNQLVIKKTRARAPAVADAALTLEPHVCRHCFGRLASVPLGATSRRYTCTNCGASESGTDATVLCACGLSVKRSGATVDAGLRCQPNPSPSPAFPSLYVAGPSKTDT
jgi:hypothetical protein